MITIRASSWSELFDCALRWYWRNVEGVRGPSSMAAHVGTSVHAGTAAFDSARLEGRAIKPADAVDAAIEAFRHPEYETAQLDGEPSEKQAERTVVEWTTSYLISPMAKQSYRAVEVRFDPLEIDSGHGVITITGQADRIDRGVTDIKTGKHAVSTKARAAQLGAYEILARAAGYEITAPATIAAPSRDGWQSLQVTNATAAMLGDERTPGLIEIAGKMAKAGLFPPNPSSILCSERYCPAWDRCSYRS